jgi:universal stress protein F
VNTRGWAVDADQGVPAAAGQDGQSIPVGRERLYRMIEKILVPLPVESAKNGSAAIAMAKDVAKAQGAKIVLLHVVEEMPAYVSVHLPADLQKNAFAAARDDMAAAAKAQGIDGIADIVVREGNPAADILDFANDTGVDMIVMSSHDPGIADYLLGSVAARVVRHAHCSVLVVRQRKG